MFFWANIFASIIFSTVFIRVKCLDQISIDQIVFDNKGADPLLKNKEKKLVVEAKVEEMFLVAIKKYSLLLWLDSKVYIIYEYNPKCQLTAIEVNLVAVTRKV